MVWIAQATAQPRSCALQPAPARPVAAYWEAANAEQLARPTLPAFSLPPPTPLAQPRGQEGWAAALPLPPSDAGSEWAQQAALVPLAALRGPTDELCREPQAVQLSPPALEPALPPFLLPRLRTSRIDEWQRRSTALADEPCLPVSDAAAAHAAGQSFRFQPQPVQLPSPAAPASGAKPFSLLDRLLQQGPQGPLAAAEPPLLDVPLPPGGQADPDAAAPSNLRRELERLAAHSDGREGTVAADAAPEGLVCLRCLGPPLEQPAACDGTGTDRAAALLERLAAAPTSVQMEEHAPAATLPSFLLPPTQQSVAWADPAASPAAPAGGDAGGSSTHQQLFSLEPPVLPAAAAVRGAALVPGAPTSAVSHLFQPVPVPAAPTSDIAWCFVPEGCQPVSLATLAAQDMILDDGSGLVLPPVQVEEPGEADSPAPALLPLIQSECGCKPANTSHLALHLNWSLSSKQAALRPPELTAAVRSLRQQLLPRPATTQPPAEVRQQGQQRQARLIRQLLVPFMHPGQQEPGSSGEASAEEAVAAHLGQPSTAMHSVELPAVHAQLLRLLRDDEQRLVATAPAPGVPAEVARSDFLSVDALQKALRAAAGQPGSRELLKLYATMTVIRQTAAMLVHHGVRCAHLYLAQSQAELPGLLSAVTAAQELQAANRQVEAGQLEDSPKLAALQRLLAGIAALAPGAKCCIIGHPKSFFTLYKAVLAAGQTVIQLDRSGALTAAAKGGGSAATTGPLAAAVQQACACAGCVLVPAALVASGQFPLAAFQQVVVYASEPATKVELRPLSQLPCPLHFLEVPLPSLGTAGPLQAAPPAAAVAAGAAAPRLAQQGSHAAGPALQAGPPGVARVQHAARTAAPFAAQPEPAAPSIDWPLIISSDPCRPIRSSRPLYEAVLALEQQGAAVVERPLSLVDLVLSPSAGLVVCNNSAAKLEFDEFLSALAPVLYRLSFAFARVVLVCEGSPGFQAQVLCGTERLLALGRRAGLRLQCHATTSAAGTAAVVDSVARAWLAKWQAGGPGMQYAVAEAPTEEEAFLTRFYSLNPHSAFLLLSLGLPLSQLLRLSQLNPLQLPKAVALIPRHCLDLFSQCAAYGQPALGIPTASVMHPGQQQQQQAYGTPPRPRHHAPVEQADSCVPAAWEQQQAWEQPHQHQEWQQQQLQQAWQQQQQRQPQAKAVAAASAAAPGWGGSARYDEQAAGHLPPVQQQAALRGGYGAYAPAAAQQAPQAAYLAAQLEGQPAKQWDSRYEPYAQMNEAVYQRGMQMMQARLRGAAIPQPAAPALPPQQQQVHGAEAHAVGAAGQQYQQYQPPPPQQQQQLYEAQQQHQQMLQYQQQEQQRQLLLQQQAEAAAFPELPGLEEGAGMEPGVVGSYPTVQQWQQQQPQGQAGQYGADRHGEHALPPLHGKRPTAGPPQGGAAYGTAAQPYAQAGYTGRWPARQQGGAGHYQQQQPGVDEFGVSVQPSMSDDESDNAAAHQQHQHQAVSHAAQPGRGTALQQMQQLLVPGRGGSAGEEGGQIGAFLGSRKRDFSVPRSAGKLPAVPAAQRGAGQVTLADAEGSYEEQEGGPAAKRQRGTSASGQFNNLLRPPAGRGGGSTGGYKRGGGGGGRWGGGGRRYGGRFGGGRSANKPSRAW
ncbi:hypothetical protein C2E21_6279 [Chlorella sorokiniana]|uniref:Uncharacterized protein n=1 Tax=Chlorella sorokiniana TaxID=3076 RepID=A0A2P6TLM1_CHLSO|nr:hypothetical protein C2E21_6279 [Chlorella sorokiniana]|eukprot:PRW45191.1 hypothetical protein C2E21_6279 [Chlorella sorokiniana]